MKHINQLKKQRNKALLVGNGPSAKNLDPKKFTGFDWWSCNDAYWTEADYVVYFDKDMQKYFSDKVIRGDQSLIGYRHKSIDNTLPQCDYYYGYDDIVFGDTGLHTLQFADRLGYEEILLCGYDYNCDINTYHYKERNSDREKLVRFLKASISNVQKYWTYNWISSILILSTNTELKSVLSRFETVEQGNH